MPKERFYTDQPLSPHAEITLTGDEAHHLFRVMRAKPGDTVELINGKNVLAHATVKTNSLHIDSIETNQSNATIILAQAIPRFNRLEYILEKCTELNVLEFWLFPGMLSEKTTFTDNQNQRMAHLLIAAMKQSGRLDLPTIHLKPPLSSWKFNKPLLFGDTSPLAPHITTLPKPHPSLIIIGPESGFHPQEHTLLHAHGQGVKLSTNILRVDTAAIAATTLLGE